MATCSKAVEEEMGESGSAEFEFSRRKRERTWLSYRRFTYPFHITRPLYLDNDWSAMATLYVQSGSGGVFDEDRLRMDVVVNDDAAAHVTTQSATKIHSMTRGCGIESVNLKVGSGATLEHMPDPFVLFPQSDFTSRIHADVAADGHALIVDSMIVHDPEWGAVARFRRYSSDITINVHRQRMVTERTMIDDSETGFESELVMHGYPSQATIFLLSPSDRADCILRETRAALSGCAGVYAGASVLPGNIGVGARVLAREGLSLRRALTACWKGFRWQVAGRSVTVRRK